MSEYHVEKVGLPDADAMPWSTFRYLNGVRRELDMMNRQLLEFHVGFKSLGIAKDNGEIDKMFHKHIKSLNEFSAMLMKRVEHERKKDITLFLEDL